LPIYDPTTPVWVNFTLDSGTIIKMDQKKIDGRKKFGLPIDKFIFTNGNQLYKIDPEIFDVWCSILKRVPNSVLWLLRFEGVGMDGEKNIRVEATKRGVHENRILFTEVAPKTIHIERTSYADLCIDTPLCNAHTTGCDTLWGGVPLITLPRESMASRVASSLVTAVGCPEMVVHDLSEYEEMVVDLALNQKKLENLRLKLWRNRLTQPLFDTRRWVRDLEIAYDTIWEMHLSGSPPKSFRVKDLGHLDLNNFYGREGFGPKFEFFT